MITYPGMPLAEVVPTNGINMTVFTAGPEDGFPIVLCHGWPELAFSWRFQIPALAAAGYRVIVPNQRGYDGSPGPEDVEAYDIFNLTGDMVGLLDHYGHEKAVFVGHDWGGIMTWQLCLLHPDRVAGHIALNTPFIPRLRADPIKLFRKAYGDEMYIVQMQEPGVVDKLLAENTERLFRYFMRRSKLNRKTFDERPQEKRNMNLFWAIQNEDDDAIGRGDIFLSDEELKTFVDAFTRSGYTGGINWYRNFTRNWEMTEDLPQHVDAPALMIMAARDVALPPSGADNIEKYVPNTTKYLVEDSGHWTQQEQPEEVNEIMIEWLSRRFWK